MKKFFIPTWIIVSLTLVVCFQNCGKQSDDGGTQKASSVEDDDNSTNLDLLSEKWTFPASNGYPSIDVYFGAIPNKPLPSGIVLEISDGATKKRLSNQGPLLESFMKEDPYRAVEATGYFLLFLSDSRDELLALSVIDDVIAIHWTVDLTTPITSNEFASLYISESAGSKTLHVGPFKIMQIETNSPSVIKVPTCSANQHLENNICVSNTRACTIANGVGSQSWSNNIWGSCTVVSCNPTYYKFGNSCLKIPTCTPSQHLENNVCVSNTKLVPITNGTALYRWNGSFYAFDSVYQCNAGYYSANNLCNKILPPVFGNVFNSPNNLGRGARLAYVGYGVTKLNGTAIGYGLTYQWYHNGKAIAGANKAELAISGFQTKDIGNHCYRVNVTNSAGSISSNCSVDMVHVYGPPKMKPGALWTGTGALKIPRNYKGHNNVPLLQTDDVGYVYSYYVDGVLWNLSYDHPGGGTQLVSKSRAFSYSCGKADPASYVIPAGKTITVRAVVSSPIGSVSITGKYQCL